MGKTKQNAGRKEAESDRSDGAVGDMLGSLASKPVSYGDTQINRNGLN